MQDIAPITFTPVEVSTYYAARVPLMKQRRAARWRGTCPIHKGKDPNFSVDPRVGLWHCHSFCERGGDILDLEYALFGGDFPTRKAEVFRLVGRVDSEHRLQNTRKNGKSSGPPPTNSGEPTSTGCEWHEVARYPYVCPDGSVLFEVIRYRKPDGTKAFIQLRPSGVEAAGTTDLKRAGSVPTGGIVTGLQAGKYLPDPTTESRTGKPTWKLAPNQDVDYGGAEYHFGDCPRVPYRLPDLLGAETVYLPEGEKDVNTLESWGLVASCNPGGSGNSRLYKEWADYFRGKHIVILPDNDGPGRKHAASVAAALLIVAASVRIVELPGLPAKGDITDWRDAGGTFERFQEMTEAAPGLNAVTLFGLRGRWGLADKEPHNLTSNPRTANAGSLTTRCLSDIEAKPVRWLWPDRIPRGKLTIIAGNPGLWKSQIVASIAAVVTGGGCWPVDLQQCKLGNVLLLNAEDDPADTLRPRLEAAGADLSRIHIVDGVTVGYVSDGSPTNRAFSLQVDSQALGSKLKELGDVAVVIIDPISAYLGDTDSHNNADVRGLLAPLSELAARYDAAIIGVSHLTKAAAAQPLMRVNGSLAFVAAARAAYLVTPDPQDKTRRLFLPMKNNLGPDATGLAFRIEGATVSSPAGPLATSRISWESEPVSITADEAIQSEGESRSVSALEEAVRWLREALPDGAVAAVELLDRANADDIAEKTLRRASKALEVRKEKASMGGGWVWSLPSKMAKCAEGAYGS